MNKQKKVAIVKKRGNKRKKRSEKFSNKKNKELVGALNEMR